MGSNRKIWKWASVLVARTSCGSMRGYLLLLLFTLFLATTRDSIAAEAMCSQFGGVVDGSNPATYAAIQNASTFGIDMDCTIKNFPLSVGGFPVTTINFHFPKQQSYNIYFLNVYYDGHIACADPTHSTFWIYWAPNSINRIPHACQSHMAPVEAVQKKNPPSQTTATIGMPFTYTITAPALGTMDPSGSFQYIQGADDATVTNVVVTDDLTTTGASLSYVSNTAYLVNAATGARTAINGGVPLKLGASSTWLAGHPAVQSDSTKHLVFSYEYNPSLASVPAGYYVEIDLTVVLDNSPANRAQTQFANTANMWFGRTVKGTVAPDLQAQPGTTLPMTIVEPHLTVAKTVSYFSPSGKPATSPAAAGDVLQYTITLTNDGSSTAYDSDVIDTLPPNIALVPGSATAQINGSPVAGFIATPALSSGGTLDWGSANGDGSLNIPVNGKLVLTFQAKVLSIDGTPFGNTAYTAWTSVSGSSSGERTGAGCPNITQPNNYCSGPATVSVSSQDPTAIAKSVVSDTWISGQSNSTDSTLRIGDTVVYSLALTLRSGTTQNVVVTDTLPAGLSYDSLVSIAPASGGNFTYTVSSQPSRGATGTVTWNLGNVSHASGTVTGNDTLTIQYRAKVVKNTLSQTPVKQALANSATMSYSINGVAAPPKTSGASINIWQPVLGVSKSAALATGGTVVSAGEVITYTVNISNTGASPAYDPVLTDTLPAGLRQNGITTTGISLINTATNAVLATLPVPASPYFSYNAATGVVTWNFDTGVANAYGIPPGDTLQVVYQVKADSTLGSGITLVNNAIVQNYYSFDSVDVPSNSVVPDRQVYGPTGTATVQLSTASGLSAPLSKRALVSSAAIGQPFTYRISVPARPASTALYNVQVLDDISLATTGVSLTYVGSAAQLASGAKSWATLANSGTPTNLVLADTSNGLYVPAGDQLIVDITVVLANDTTNNTVGKQFSNTANYTYNRVSGDATSGASGAPGSSSPVTIAGPNLTLTKSGPGTMSAGTPGTFTLNIQNIGSASAWNATITDVLPNVTQPAKGGMCGQVPANITARVYQSDGVTPVSSTLVNGTDFTASFTGLAGTPACTLTISLRSTAATAIAPTNRLIITYQASLDQGTAGGIALTNVAGATSYQSADPSAPGATGNVHTTTNTLTNGTPGILDFQDAFTVNTQSTVLTFTKTVFDATSGQSGVTARPGDTLKYTLTLQNTGGLAASNLSITDELDKLNPSAMFVPGSLTLTTVPAGANVSQTSATGGAKGTGLVSIGNLAIDAQGGANDKLVVEFTVRLLPVIKNGTKVLNQGQVGSSTLPSLLSNDPSQGGGANPTVTTIVSAPVFRVQKTVQDITSGTQTVTAGDTLRYTIRVNNVGTEDAVGVTLRDLVPANTSYVAGSTTLNGAAVADMSAGVSPLQNGMPINARSNPTPGAMPADASASAANTATVTFDVKISVNVVNGTIISNQGFVDGSGTGSGPVPEQPSGDPNNPVPNSPTMVIVGNLPLLSAQKTVKLSADNNGNGLVDPGDIIRFTITLTNAAATPASGVVLTDAVPANTTYISGSTTLNGSAVADAGAGVSPLASGMAVATSGTMAANSTGTITFDVRVNAGVAPGTTVCNQGTVAATALPPLLTDSDGNPANGYQPTCITVGNAEQLALTKAYAVVGGGAPLPGSIIEYTVTATNIGTVPATSVVITDDLSPILAQSTYVAGSAAMNGSTNGVTFTPPVITANYGATYGALAPGGTVVLRFRVKLNATLTTGTAVTNTAQAAWNIPQQTTTASVTIDLGSQSGSLSGRVWEDANFNKVFDSGDQPFSGWAADVYRDGQIIGTAYTASDGTYQISGLAPNAGTTSMYEIRFRAPGAGANTAMLGWGDSPFTNGMQRISNIVLASGGSLANLNLPLTPNGVVYDAVARTPIAGATLTMLSASSKSPLPAGCFNDPGAQGQVTLPGGNYKFDLNFSDPSACPSGGDYLIQVTPPSSGYIAGVSKLVPPTSSASTATFSVPTCPGGPADAVPATSAYCEAEASVLPQPASVPAGPATASYLHLTFDNARPGDSQIYNNHIAIDPVQSNAIAITKTTTMVNVSIGQMVPYTITITNTLGADLTNLEVVDTPPPGFKYVSGSGVVDGVKVEPAMSGTQLIWSISTLAAKSQHTINLILVVGAGVTNGDYVNKAQVVNSSTGAVVAKINPQTMNSATKTAQAVNSAKGLVPSGARAAVSSNALSAPAPGSAASVVAVATVRVAPDPTMDCTDIIGKVFDDSDANGYPDEGEPGLAGVRIVSANGLIATTDKFGRFHITCALVPDPDRGSNFILKLDDRTLPTGYRITTENPLVLRVTRGKMTKFNFGAALHRVVRLDIADGVFEPKTAVMREQWKARVDTLIGELKKAPSILRISYLADVEEKSVVSKRIEAVKEMVSSLWGQGPYMLTIETEIYWRRGGPAGKSSFESSSAVVTARTASAGVPAEPASSGNGVSDAHSLGQAVERHAAADLPRILWIEGADAALHAGQDEKAGSGTAREETVKTVKLQNLVPPLHFGSKEASIPEDSVQRLKEILSGMQGKNNVRLHLVGPADDAQMAGESRQRDGDNTTLSGERAAAAALTLQKALGLPPDAVTYESAGETGAVAGSASSQGKKENRVIEVEVWYDETPEHLAQSGAPAPEQGDREKVCRVETLCKLSYKEGHSRRARVRNIVPPLHMDDDMAAVPEGFISKVRQVLENLRTKEHVVVKFIGYTDNQPLSERNERIYGNPVSLSKARARRTALAVREALKLSSSAIDVDGKGADAPIASNDTEKGRAQNRRIEVEFWYDDELQVLPDELQPCPEPAGAETVTRVYDGPSGGIKPIVFDHGEPVITPEQLEQMRRSLEEVKDKHRARLRFIGYNNDERLDRRTALVYGDDIGLSTSRARRAMDIAKDRLGLRPGQAEFEGHGYVQSDDVAATGFVESDTARVEVRVVYDEMMARDNTDGLDITKVTRDVSPKDPLALNLMRITVDGKPLDDPDKSIADIERCTDVALSRANVQFKFDDLDLKPRLNVTAWPNTIRYTTDPDAVPPENLIRFRMYTNYQAFIARSEVRIFDKDTSVAGTPLAIVPVDKDGRASWQPTFPEYKAPGRELRYVLRVYDVNGRFDETKPLPIWIVDRQSPDLRERDAEKELLVGYGENHLSVDNIQKKGGTVKVYGSSVPADHEVFVAGSPVPLGDEGKFVTEEILPSGTHSVEVAVLDKAGNGQVYLRDIELKKSDWFAVGIADLTISRDYTTGPGSFLADQTLNTDAINYDGRLAYYVKGKFGDGWQLTSSADTQEQQLKDIFRNFNDRTPNALFRSIDSKYFYPTYGDDGRVEEGAPTLGKFYLKVGKDESYGMWGDFKINYGDNDLARIDRGLYGANVRYQTPSTTSFGEKRFFVDGFSAQPGTVATREEFLGTGGSLYYLHHQTVLTGSESVMIEVRDKDSGIVIAAKNLTPSLDYTIDYLQGRISLQQPLSPTASDTMLVNSGTAAGNRMYLVVRYEYVPSAGDTNSMSLGGRTHVWLNDYVKLGVTANRDGGSDNPNELTAADLTLRKSALSWVKVETSRSSGPGLTSLASNDGGMTTSPACQSFTVSANGVLTANPACSSFGSAVPVSAGAYRVDASLGFADVFAGASGQWTMYMQSLDAGYSAPGLQTATDTKQYGGTFKAPLSSKVDVSAKGDKTDRAQGLDTSNAEVDLNYHMTEHWTLSPGLRIDTRHDNSPVVPPTQTEGDRTDAALRATYDSKERWSAYGFVQDTVEKTGNREDNGRIGSGGEYRITDRFKLVGEVSDGDLGGAGKLGMEYLYSDRTNMYLNYVYDNETPDNGMRAGNASIVSGFKTRYSDSASVYAEEKYTYGNVPTGLTHAAGVDLAPFDHWNLGVSVDYGTLRDPITDASLVRQAAALRVGYGNKGFIWATTFEYRVDRTEVININPDSTMTASTVNRDSWLVKNDVKYQIDDSSRVIGKFNHAESRSEAAFFGGNYTEAVIGYGYRPVTNDRLNTLFKYTYFYNVPTTSQVNDTVTYTSAGVSTGIPANSIQKSHIVSLDATYDLTQKWSIGGKYAYRLGWVSETLQDPVFFENRAALYIARAEWHFVHLWEAMVEARLLDLPDAHDKKSGFLTAVYRQMGAHIKAGIGYNFSDFSDDLTQLNYKHQGFFVNLIGEF